MTLVTYIAYMLIACLAVPLFIYAVLKAFFRKADAREAGNIDTECYIMRYKKSGMAVYIGILAAVIAFVYMLQFMPLLRGFPSIFFVIISAVILLHTCITIYASVVWRVIVRGGMIEVSLPFRRKRVFSFEDIVFALEEPDSIVAPCHIYISAADGEPVKVFTMMTTIFGYEAFMHTLRVSGKIKGRS